MFDSVLNRGETTKRRFGTGAFVSVAFHGGLLAGALWLSTRPTVTPAKPTPPIVYYAPPRRTSAPPATPRPTTQPKTERPTRPRAPIQPTRIEPRETQPEESTPPPEVDAAQAPPDDPVGDPGGENEPSEGPGRVVGGEPSSTIAIPFTEGMTRPVLLEGRNPQYTREALAAHIDGVMTVRCVITTDGFLEQCKILRGLPYMNDEMLSVLATRRYQPVTFQGHPVAVDYVFNIRLLLPGH